MLLPREELEGLAVMDPTIVDFLAKNPKPPTDFSNYKAVRAAMKEMENDFNVNGVVKLVSPELETYHDIPMRDSFKSALKIHKPANGHPGPLIVLAFGGGFVAGTVNQLTRPARALVKLFGATVVCISYRVAPEYKYPVAQHDTWDSMKWIADNATGQLLNSDPTRGFIMGGVSAGGAMTASLSRIFQQEPLAHPLTGQWLCVASMMDPVNVPEDYKQYYLSNAQQAGKPGFSTSARTSLKDIAQWDSLSPLRFAINSRTPISGQPPTYFQVAGADPLRDDSLIYDQLLVEAGVPTRLDMYPGCPHGHLMGFVGLEITNRANIDTILGFGWLLGTSISREAAAEAIGL